MICPRHRAIASHMEHAYPYCYGCFREAIAHAEDALLEAHIRTLRTNNPSFTINTTNGVLRRLAGR
jgi:hypothetical protein